MGRRRPLAALALALLALFTSAPTAGADNRADRPHPATTRGVWDSYDPWLGRPTFRNPPPGPLTSTQYIGIDGHVHQRSPLIVPGRRGTLYYGEELDGACGYGPQFKQGLRNLTRLARVIERSGRRVVFTVGPNKSAVNKHDIRKGRLPHGKCDLMGIDQQDRALDRLSNRNYLPMRKTLADLARPSRQLYWKIDTHWTKLSTVRYAEALAARFSRKVADLQTYRRGRERIITDMSFLGILDDVYERGPARFPTTKVRVTTPPGSVPYNPDVVINPEHRWHTKPGHRTIRGQTLLVGDSFTYRGLDSLMPLFRHGRFLWISDLHVPTILEAIPRADTVVVEVVQRWIPISAITQPGFRHALSAALARHDRRQ